MHLSRKTIIKETLKTIFLKYGMDKLIVEDNYLDEFCETYVNNPEAIATARIFLQFPDYYYILNQIILSLNTTANLSFSDPFHLVRMEYELENGLIELFSVMTNGAEFALICAIAGQSYENRANAHSSMAFVPADFQGAAYYMQYQNLPILDYDSIYEMRKALEVANGEQCLIIRPDEQGVLCAVGYGKYSELSLHYPTVRFENKMQWSFLLPRSKQTGSKLHQICVFRAENGCFKFPKVSIDETVKHRIQKYLNRNFKSTKRIQEKVSKIVTFLETIKEQDHGTAMVWLRCDDVQREVKRLCVEANRGYPINPHIGSSKKNINLLKNITSIDGALLCDFDSGECVAYGVILDGPASDNGLRSRGARYNSLRAYIDGRTWAKDSKSLAIAVIRSEDGMIDIMTPNDSA